MKKKSAIVISIIALFITGVFLTVGNALENPIKKRNKAYDDRFSISSDNHLAYMKYENGKSILYLSDKDMKKSKLIDEIDEEYIITHISFSPDAQKILYVITASFPAEENSKILQYAIATKEKTELVSYENANVNEVYYTDDNSSLVFFAPHNSNEKQIKNFQLVEFNPTTKEQHTIKEIKSNMNPSLYVSKDGSTIYYSRDDAIGENDYTVGKSEMIQLSLKNPNITSKIKLPDNEVLDYSFSADGKEMIFNAIANPESKEDYEYEIFSFNKESRQVTQLTFYKGYGSQPQFSQDGSRIYFLLDLNRGKSKENFSIHYVDMNTKEITNLENDG